MQPEMPPSVVTSWPRVRPSHICMCSFWRFCSTDQEEPEHGKDDDGDDLHENLPCRHLSGGLTGSHGIANKKHLNSSDSGMCEMEPSAEASPAEGDLRHYKDLALSLTEKLGRITPPRSDPRRTASSSLDVPASSESRISCMKVEGEVVDRVEARAEDARLPCGDVMELTVELSA